MLKAPFQLLQRGVRAVETITADVMMIYMDASQIARAICLNFVKEVGC
jgi:hypothetical protein